MIPSYYKGGVAHGCDLRFQAHCKLGSPFTLANVSNVHPDSNPAASPSKHEKTSSHSPWDPRYPRSGPGSAALHTHHTTSFQVRMDSAIKLLASFNNREKACNMLCGKGRDRTQDLGYQSGAL
jgi:hypothetical protein